jgi:predicted secreted protein
MTEAIRSHGALLQLGDGGIAGSPITITSTGADPWATLVLTEAVHGLKDGDPVLIAGVAGTGATAANGSWRIRKVGTKAFTIPVATTGEGAGGTATPVAETFTTVAQVGDIKGPTASSTKLDVTTHDAQDDYERFLMTVKAGGTVTFPINWIASNAAHKAIIDAFEDELMHNWRLIPPDDPDDPTIIAFAAAVQAHSLDLPVHGVIKKDITLEISGKPQYTYAGS